MLLAHFLFLLRIVKASNYSRMVDVLASCGDLYTDALNAPKDESEVSGHQSKRFSTV
jgi:hypothetical protein